MRLGPLYIEANWDWWWFKRLHWSLFKFTHRKVKQRQSTTPLTDNYWTRIIEEEFARVVQALAKEEERLLMKEVWNDGMWETKTKTATKTEIGRSKPTVLTP